MKKIVLIIAIIGISLAFNACGNDNVRECRICDEGIVFVEACDNGDGTGSLTVSVNGVEVFSETDELEEGENIEDFNCDDFANDFDLNDIDLDNLTDLLDENNEITIE